MPFPPILNKGDAVKSLKISAEDWIISWKKICTEFLKRCCRNVRLIYLKIIFRMNKGV